MKSIYPNLSNLMAERGMTYDDLAEVTLTDADTVSQKMIGLIPWLLVDAMRICSHFRTSDINFLFLQLDTNT